MTNPRTESALSRLVVVTPHPQHLHHPYVLQHLNHQPVLDVDASGAASAQISHQGFVNQCVEASAGFRCQHDAPGLSMLCRGQRLNATCRLACPCLPFLIDHPYGEEEITRLEDERLPAMQRFPEWIVDAVFCVGKAFWKRSGCDRSQPREARAEQEAEVELAFNRAANGSGC